MHAEPSTACKTSGRVTQHEPAAAVACRVIVKVLASWGRVCLTHAKGYTALKACLYNGMRSFSGGRNSRCLDMDCRHQHSLRLRNAHVSVSRALLRT